MPRAVNQAGIDLVKHFEGFRSDADGLHLNATGQAKRAAAASAVLP